MKATDLWAFRARAEADAASMFAYLAAGLEAVGAHPNTQAMTQAAIEDEIRHQGLCEDLVRHFGGTASRTPVRVRPERARTRESVLAEVVGMCCINETVSVAALTVMQKNTRDTPVHAVVTAILRDEIKHARIGWSHLAFEAGRGEVAGLSARIPELLEASIRGLREEPADGITPALRAAGGLDQVTRTRIFEQTIEQVVWPGLTALGVSGAGAANDGCCGPADAPTTLETSGAKTQVGAS